MVRAGSLGSTTRIARRSLEPIEAALNRVLLMISKLFKLIIVNHILPNRGNRAERHHLAARLVLLQLLSDSYFCRRLKSFLVAKLLREQAL